MIVCIGLVLTGVLSTKDALPGLYEQQCHSVCGHVCVEARFLRQEWPTRLGNLVAKTGASDRHHHDRGGPDVGLLIQHRYGVLIPVVIGIAAKSVFPRSRLLMPLVFAAALER